MHYKVRNVCKSQIDFNKQDKREMKGVYFVCIESDSNYVKIGQTKDLSIRFKRLTNTPYDYELLAFREVDNEGEESFELRDALERNYHELFKKHHHRGEWFYLDQQILDVIDYINSKSSIKPQLLSY